MKKTTIILLLLSLLIYNCNNDDDNNNDTNDPIRQLPPATQTGANTFGCLLDGEVFLPGSGQNTLDCVYQFVNGGYYFSLQANNRDEDNNIVLIGLSTNELQITENQTLELLENNPVSAYGTLAIAAQFKYTSETETGELRITKFDLENNIISGTFYFDIIDFNGELRQIREGRFDMRFTQ